MSFEKGKVKAELGGVLTKRVATWAPHKWENIRLAIKVAIISYHELKCCFDYSLRRNTSWWHSSPYLTPWGVGGQKTKSTTIMLEASTVTHFLPHRTWIWLKPRSYEVWISIDSFMPGGRCNSFIYFRLKRPYIKNNNC